VARRSIEYPELKHGSSSLGGVSARLVSGMLCVISGEIVTMEDTIIWKAATCLTQNIPKVIVLLQRSLIARSVNQPAFGIINLKRVNAVSLRKLSI